MSAAAACRSAGVVGFGVAHVTGFDRFLTGAALVRVEAKPASTRPKSLVSVLS